MSKIPIIVMTVLLCAGLNLPTVYAMSVHDQGTWETTLQGRSLYGSASTIEAYYDTELDITWLADANFSRTTNNWFAANEWASELNIGGYDDWRLPRVYPIDGTIADDARVSYNGSEDRAYNVSAPGTEYAGSTANEMAHLFYNTLGNTSQCDPSTSTAAICDFQSDYGLSNTGPFRNVQRNFYWTATEYALDSNTAWYLATYDGLNNFHYKTVASYAWAVSAGDIGVAPLPLPAAVWLFGVGMFGLWGVASRRSLLRL